MKRLLLFALLFTALRASAAEIKPNLKALICTGDYGMWAQDRVPMIRDAVAKAAPAALVDWQAEQAFNFSAKLEAPGWAGQFDVIVMGDISLGQITPRAQQNLVQFVQNGGGLVYVMWAKSNLPFQGVPEANPMPLAAIVPYQYPDSKKPRGDATVLAADAPFFAGIDFSSLTETNARAALPQLLLERSEGKGRVLVLYGAFGPSWKQVAYATYEKVPGSWDAWPGLGELWARVLERAAPASPIRAQSRASVEAKIQNVGLRAVIDVDGTRAIDEIRAANFSIVALQQLYNEDGSANEDLFLALNPRDWFDRRSQEVLPNTKGKMADKPAFFRDFNIKGIYMADNSYGSYGGWSEDKYAEQIAKAIGDKQKWPAQLAFFQAGNEPPLDENYVKFHQRLVGEVLKGAPDYKVIGPNKAFNLLGVKPEEMRFYIEQCGKTTDVLNWHTYAQPPAMTLAEARYWSDWAAGKMRSPGAAPVMFTESDSWNTRESQFNYLMQRAFTFLPEKRILGTFQYCMEPRSEGGPYKFGVLQPEGEMAANYNGYWVWRNLRGQMTPTRISGLDEAAQGHLHAISSRSADGKTFTTVVFYDTGYFDGAGRKRADKVHFTLRPHLPPGDYTLDISDVTWNTHATREANAKSPVEIELAPCQAAALTWTKR